MCNSCDNRLAQHLTSVDCGAMCVSRTRYRLKSASRLFIVVTFIVVGICWAMEDRGMAVILNFNEPGLNDVVGEVLHKDTDIEAYSPDGSVVEDEKLSQFTLSLESRCYEVPQTHGDPRYRDCTAGYYQVATLRYGEHDTLDCLRVSTMSLQSVLNSIRPVVLKRFHLKVYYLMADGLCYVKYFTLPMYECSSSGHRRLSHDRCQQIFELNGKF